MLSLCALGIELYEEDDPKLEATAGKKLEATAGKRLKATAGKRVDATAGLRTAGKTLEATAGRSWKERTLTQAEEDRVGTERKHRGRPWSCCQGRGPDGGGGILERES